MNAVPSAAAPSGPAPVTRFLDRVGLPAPLAVGYLGLLIFMIGDGIESGFIAPFIAANGAGGDIRASYVVTAYGVTVMLASWLYGALSQLWGPRRVMIIGLVIWLVFHAAFLGVAVVGQNYALMLLFYGLRGFGYPMFAFGFLVWITAVAPSSRMGAAVGWFYFAFTGGLPTLGALVASFTNPVLGHYGTLWLSLGVIALGGVLCLAVRERTGYARMAAPGVRPMQSLMSSMSIAWQNPRVGLGTLVRVINTAPMFGMLVLFPTIFAERIGFGEGRWLLLVSTIFGTNIFFNLIFGLVSDRLGWRATIFWFGAVGCSVSTLLLYFVPTAAGADHYGLALIVGALYGATLAGFVPISALLPSMAPENRGGAVALLNFGAGAATFVGPAVVSLLLGPVGPGGVVITFSALYVIAAVMTRFLTVPGPDAGAPSGDRAAEEPGAAPVSAAPAG